MVTDSSLFGIRLRLIRQTLHGKTIPFIDHLIIVFSQPFTTLELVQKNMGFMK
jgi:uncharacterized protein YdaL